MLLEVVCVVVVLLQLVCWGIRLYNSSVCFVRQQCCPDSICVQCCVVLQGALQVCEQPKVLIATSVTIVAWLVVWHG